MVNSAVEGIRNTALKHSRRASRLWKESEAIINSTDASIPREQAIQKAKELNEQAMDECQKALRSFEFLRRYDSENS